MNSLMSGRREIPHLAMSHGTIDATLDAVKDGALAAAYGFGKLRNSHQVVRVFTLGKQLLNQRRQPVDLNRQSPYLSFSTHFNRNTQVSTIPRLLTTNS